MKTAVVQHQRGFTMAELLVTVAVVAILLSIAAPSFGKMLSKRRLEGAATELFNDLQYARSQAVADNRQVQLVATTSSYVISAVNPPAKTYRTVSELPPDVALNAGATVVFAPLRGCMTDNSCSADDLVLDVKSSSTPEKLRVVVNNMGRVRLCSPDGSFKGYTTC